MSKTIDMERAKQAIGIHIAEYQALRNEIELDLNLQHSLANYAIAITGGAASLFVLGQPTFASQAPFILLIVSILLSAISWAILDLGYSIQSISTYIQNNLTPKIQILLGHADERKYVVLEWETYAGQFTPRLAIRGITSSGKYSVSFIPSVIMIVVSYSYYQFWGRPWMPFEILLFYVAIIMAALVPAVGVANSIHMVRRSWNNKKGSTAQDP